MARVHPRWAHPAWVKRLPSDWSNAFLGSSLPAPTPRRIDMGAPAATRADVVQRVRASRADLVLVALGAPKQELWNAEAAADLRPAVLLRIGAAVDFVAGTARRAPKWVSASGLEWLYRLGREPRRLWRRYLLRDPEFLFIVLRQLRGSRAKGEAGSGSVKPEGRGSPEGRPPHGGVRAIQSTCAAPMATSVSVLVVAHPCSARACTRRPSESLGGSLVRRKCTTPSAPMSST